MVNIPSTIAPASVFNVLSDIKMVPANNYTVQDARQRLGESKLFKNIRIEATSSGKKLIKSNVMPRELGLNGFAEAIHLAYSQHHGLALYPDHVFIAILQGLSIHISENPDKHRSVLGLGGTAAGTKEAIDISLNSLRLGDPKSNWEAVFPMFSKEIGKRVSKDVYKLLASPYSTSTPLSTAVSSLTIMDVFKNYFTYSVSTYCGIPNIALMGTKRDWKLLMLRTKKLLGKFDDLGFWSEQLIPILEKFVIAADNKGVVDKEFWSKIYKPLGTSGGPYIRGWINAFVPYTQDEDKFVRNRFIEWEKDFGPFNGLIYNDIPAGFTKTPFTWNYYTRTLPMEFVGGFLGVEEVKSTKALDGFVSPALGWAVIHAPKN